MQMKAERKPLERIANKANRVNLKHKRKQNLIKKGIELNKVFEMDVLIVLRDRDTGRYSQYTSGDKVSGHFSLERAMRELENLKKAGMQLKLYDDDDFAKLNKWP